MSDPLGLPPVAGPAAAIGLATIAGDVVLDVWYPAPTLGAIPKDVPDISSGINSTETIGAQVRSISTTIADLSAPP